MKELGAFYKRGFLSLMLLWKLSKKPMSGKMIAEEIEKKRGKKPKPGTLYPALKGLEKKKLIKRKSTGQEVVYELTSNGKKALKEAVCYFRKAFSEILR